MSVQGDMLRASKKQVGAQVLVEEKKNQFVRKVGSRHHAVRSQSSFRFTQAGALPI